MTTEPMPNPPNTPPAWYAGLDAEHIGHVQTKGWDKLDAAAAAIELAKAHRSAEKYVGVPADQLIRVPKDLSDEAGWKAVWGRLGAPAEAAGYDFTAIDFGDEALTGKFHDAFRTAAANLNMPKAMAESFAKSVYDAIDGYGQASEAESAAAVQAEQAKLRENWGTNFQANMFVADRAAERLGVTPDVMEKLKDGMGGAAVAELFRKIGVGMGEDRFVRDPGAGGRDVMTREQAIARKTELLGDGRRGSGDLAFQERYMKGDAAARREVEALNRLITGQM